MATSSSTRRMIGGIEETSASFEARSAPRSYPTEAVFAAGRQPAYRARERTGSLASARGPVAGGGSPGGVSRRCRVRGVDDRE